MAGSKIYRFDEVAKHDDAEDCWLIVSGKVYDVSSYMAEHPGGRDVLLSATGTPLPRFEACCRTAEFKSASSIRWFAGKDATVEFDNVGHSSSGRELMDNYCVGTIDSSTLPKDGDRVKPQQAPEGSADRTPEFVMRILQFIAPVMILGFAFVVRHFTK